MATQPSGVPGTGISLGKIDMAVSMSAMEVKKKCEGKAKRLPRLAMEPKSLRTYRNGYEENHGMPRKEITAKRADLFMSCFIVYVRMGLT